MTALDGSVPADGNGLPRLAGNRPLAGLEEGIDALRQTGAMLWQRGWSVGTSSNYSLVTSREPLELLVTASGKDKGHLTRADFVRIDGAGQPLVPGQPKSSAETMLHVVLAQQPGVGAILHTHSIFSTLLSDVYFPQGGLSISGYEMLKGLAGFNTHACEAWVEIFDNTQDIPALAEQVFGRVSDSTNPLRHGFLIRKHGLYTWGEDLAEARRHVEIFEFLFECCYRRLALEPAIRQSVPLET